MAELIYNIFLHFENDICTTVSYQAHDYCGSDKLSIEFLKGHINKDFSSSVKLDLSKSFTRSEYNASCRLGEGHYLYDELLAEISAGAAPLIVTTPVRDGRLFFNYSSEHDALDINDVSSKLGRNGIMNDWLVKYTDDKGINISQLIHDDYFLAIKVTFNARLYVSAMKLMVSCIDSLAYIEYGNDRNSVPFINWLNAYADLNSLGITAPELWELRNGILHMTNLNSTKTRNAKIRRISFLVGGPPNYPREDSEGVYYFDFHGLMQVFSDAQGRWLETYNINREKFAKFVERYDETVSDSRLAFVHLDSGVS